MKMAAPDNCDSGGTRCCLSPQPSAWVHRRSASRSLSGSDMLASFGRGGCCFLVFFFFNATQMLNGKPFRTPATDSDQVPSSPSCGSGSRPTFCDLGMLGPGLEDCSQRPWKKPHCLKEDPLSSVSPHLSIWSGVPVSKWVSFLALPG